MAAIRAAADPGKIVVEVREHRPRNVAEPILLRAPIGLRQLMAAVEYDQPRRVQQIPQVCNADDAVRKIGAIRAACCGCRVSCHGPAFRKRWR